MKNEAADSWIKNFVVLSSLSLAILGALGYSSSKIYYAEFGVDFFQFAGFSDLPGLWLMNPVGVFIVLSILLATCFGVGASMLFHKEIEEPGPHAALNSKRNWLLILGSLTISTVISKVIAGLIVLGLADRVKSGFDGLYTVALSNDNQILRCAPLVGNTSSVFIFWDAEAYEAIIVPRSQVKYLRVSAGPADEGADKKSLVSSLFPNSNGPSREEKIKRNCHA